MRLVRSTIFFCLVATTSFSGRAAAQCAPDSVLDLLRDKVGTYATIRVDYVRDVRSILFGDRAPEKGTLWIAPPTLYRVETNGQTYVRGKDTLWTYSTGTGQVTIRTGDLSAAEFGPAGFFGSLQEDFMIVGCSLDPIGDHSCWKVRLAAKTETAAIQRVTLWVDQEDLIPRAAEYVDYNEETSNVKFVDYKFDQASDAQQFTFVPPKDADIIVLPLKKSNRKTQ